MEQNTQTSIKTEPELEIDLMEILHLIRQYWLWIIEAGLCVGGICFLVCTLLIAPKYTASTEVYILHQQSDSHTITYSDLQTGTYLTDDYKELITSLPVLEKVIAQLDLDLTPAQFESRITVSTPEDTRIIRIEVEDEDPYQAHQIADTLRIAASAQIEQVMEIQAVKTVQEAMDRIIHQTSISGMDMILAGSNLPNPSEMLSREAFTSLLAYAREQYDYVIIDAPPIASVIDAAVIAPSCDGIVFVIAAGQVNKRAALQVKQQLEKTGTPILGAILNKVEISSEKYYGKYYGNL